MDQLLLKVGAIIGVLGMLLCVAAGITRLTGLYYVAGMSVGAALQGGMAGVLIGTFLLMLQHARTH